MYEENKWKNLSKAQIEDKENEREDIKVYQSLHENLLYFNRATLENCFGCREVFN